MTPQRKLYLIACKLDNVDNELRHRLLDVSEELLSLADSLTEFPSHLQPELSEMIAELRSVQPQFSSHRNTSVLFDREGLGRAGRERAALLAQRIITLASEVNKEP